ncbi:hypothetical protein S83_012743, partial [Arachis hypogaea]
MDQSEKQSHLELQESKLAKYLEILIDPSYRVSCKTPHEWVDKIEQKLLVVAYDFGIKQNILRSLACYGCKIIVVLCTWPASEILKMKPNMVLFINGPGDPSDVPYAIETVRDIIGKVLVFEVCMGHQLLGQAIGGKTFKMKFGHHGENNP